MIIPPEPVTVRPDTTVTFSCLAWSYGGLVYRWDKNDSLTLPSNSSVFFQDKSFPADSSCFTTVYELEIVNTQVIDEGWYCCEASNDCGTNKECAWLEVDSKLYRIMGNYRGRKFSRLTSIKALRRLNFKDCL